MGRDFDQVEPGPLGHRQRLVRFDNAHLIARLADQANLRNANLPIHARAEFPPGIPTTS